QLRAGNPTHDNRKTPHRFWGRAIPTGKQGSQDGHHHACSVYRYHPVSTTREDVRTRAWYPPSRKPGTAGHATERKATIPHHGLHGKLPSKRQPQCLPNDKKAVHPPIYIKLYQLKWKN